MSFARLACAPLLFRLLWLHSWNAALELIVFAAITDALDGFLARRWQVSSRLGEVLDPIADKVLLSGAFVTLALSGGIEKWLAGIVLGRDALILLAAGAVLAVSKTARRFPPSIWGKISTAVQIALVLAIAGQSPALILELLKWMTAAFTVWSGIDYAGRLSAARGS